MGIVTVTTHKFFLVAATFTALLKPQGIQKILPKVAIPVNVRHIKEAAA